MIDFKNVEIHETKNGTIFAIRNIRQSVKRKGKEDIITFKADIAGDLEAGKKYLETLTFSLLKGFETFGTKVSVVKDIDRK